MRVQLLGEIGYPPWPTEVRDLYDLWALANIGGLDAEAAGLWVRLGPTGIPPTPRMFTAAPDAASWHAQMAGQTRLTVTAEEALKIVGRAWTTAVDSSP